MLVEGRVNKRSSKTKNALSESNQVPAACFAGLS